MEILHVFRNFNELGRSTVSTKGQLVIPLEVRRFLRLSAGTDIVFLRDEAGRVFLVSQEALQVERQKVTFQKSKALLERMRQEFGNREPSDVIGELRDEGD